MVANKKNEFQKIIDTVTKAAELSKFASLGLQYNTRTLQMMTAKMEAQSTSKKLMDQIKSSPSYQIAEQINQNMKGFRALEAARAASDMLTGQSQVAKLLEQIRLSTESVEQIKRYGYGFAAFTPVWIEEQKNSLLFSYLTSQKSQTEKLFEVLSASFESNYLEGDVSDLAELTTIQPKLEAEIIDVINRGGDISELSSEAKSYLSSFWVWLWDYLNKVAIMTTVVMGGVAVVAFFEASTSVEVRETAKSLSAVQREMLSDSSVVSADNVIVRAKPNKGTAILGRMKIGTIVENIGGDTNTWIHVKVDIGGEIIEGWVARRYLLKL